MWPGWARSTVFPQAVGLGGTWNTDLVRCVGEAVGKETRPMRARDDRVGLNVWSPTVQCSRFPRVRRRLGLRGPLRLARVSFSV